MHGLFANGFNYPGLPMERQAEDLQFRYDAGLKTRTEVLGKAWVEKSMAGVDDFNREFTELLRTEQEN